MEYVEALEAKALLAVLCPDDEAWFRHVWRWYAKTFHTPLHLVPKLPVEDVLTAYFEERFEDMEPVERNLHLQRLTETPEERETRKKKEAQREEADDRFFDSLNAEVLAGKLKGPPAEAKKPKVAALPPAPKEPPALPPISMDFKGGNLGFEDLLDLDPLAPPKKVK